MTKDNLGSRMKEYENVSRNYLLRRVPVIIRLDGCHFHTFTKGLNKPFDRFLMTVMQETMLELCRNIQGCVFGYTQSDEITLVLTDYKTIKTSAWFDYNIQKLASVASSMATLYFNRIWNQKWPECFRTGLDEKVGLATFDARCFNIPKEEVANCLIWRQKDATRNSIEAVAQASFRHSELDGKSCDQLQEMLWQEKGINWNEFPTDAKRGSACYRQIVKQEIADPTNPGDIITVERNPWVIDREMPILTQSREYVEQWL